MSFFNSVVLLFAAAGAYGTALMFGTLGEILTEKSGNLNLGVEGIMYMGGIFGLIAPNVYEAAVGEGNVVNAQRHWPRLPRSASAKKNGTPVSAVTTPMGKIAPRTTDLLTTDAAQRMSAPHSDESGR